MQTVFETRQKTRPATQDELYDAGFISKDVIINGKNCLERQKEIIWCEE